MVENPYQSPRSVPELRGSWFRPGGPWGLLAKTNPKATVASAARQGAIWATIGAVVWFIATIWRGPFPIWTAIPTCLFFGAIGALVEWQVDDLDDASELDDV